MENMKLTLNTGIKLIDIENERGEVVYTLRINTADSNVAKRYAEVLDNLNHVTDEFEEEAKELEKQEDGQEKTLAAASLHVRTIQKCMDEIESIFGENCLRGIYHECYELNEDFVPDEGMLVEFLEKVMPVMETLFNERFEAHRKKYNINRKGKR